MTCPVCGETAAVKYHQIEQPGTEGRQLQCCQECALEARKQINAAASGTRTRTRTRSEAVKAALS